MSNAKGHERISTKEIAEHWRGMFPPTYEPQLPWEIRISGTSHVHCDFCPKKQDEYCGIACHTQQRVVVGCEDS